MITLTKPAVEQAGLRWRAGMGWSVGHGPNVAPYSRSTKCKLSSLGGVLANGLA